MLGNKHFIRRAVCRFAQILREGCADALLSASSLGLATLMDVLRLTYGCDSLYLDEMLWSGRFLQAKPGNEAGNEGKKNEATNRVHAG